MKVGTDGTLLGAWARGGARVLDIGTGTGVVALMMAQRCPQSRVDAIDVDAEACAQARENVLNSPFAERISVVNSSLQDYSVQCAAGTYDAVVSNPPFFSDALKSPDARRTVARHTDSLPFRDLAKGAFRLLNDDGEFSLIVPADERRRLEPEALAVGFFPSRVCFVRTTMRKPPRRCLLAFRKSACPVEQTELTIGSDEYRRLLEEFRCC